MKFDDECRECLYNSQLSKVKKGKVDGEKFEIFRRGVKSLCDNPPETYCAPLLARDINLLHREIFGEIIDYSDEKSLFNLKLLALENELYSLIISAPDPLEEALKYAMAANYIDFARLSNLGGDSVDVVIGAARKSTVDGKVLSSFKQKLKNAKTLCVLHDNCGEIVLDKILIRVVLLLYPQIKVKSIVRGKPVINDVTEKDAKEVGLDKIAEVIPNGTDIPATYLKEISKEAYDAIYGSDVLLSKGLGNLETLYGEGTGAFYAFTCKCAHIAGQFDIPLWSSAFVEEKAYKTVANR